MDEFDTLVEAVTDVANAICKKRGYAVTVKSSSVALTLEAYFRIRHELKEEKDGKGNHSQINNSEDIQERESIPGSYGTRR